MIAKQPATPVATDAVTDWFWNGNAGKAGMASMVGAAESAP
jgi:hypothetical protein